MLKWTVSRSLSNTSSTPHAPPTSGRPTRKPFRDLSNTPPTGGSICSSNSSSCSNTRPRVIIKTNNNIHDSNTTLKATPVRRRRCKSHGSDLRSYFNATKPNLRNGKRQSITNVTTESPKTESFYQSTPRVDTDIGPLTYIPQTIIKNSATGSTLPSDPTILSINYHKKFHSNNNINSHNNNNDIPQNIINETRINLQSHVSDFFQQISVAGSPEDVMEAGSVPFVKSRNYENIYHSKFTKISKLHSRNKTPYNNINKIKYNNISYDIKETPLSRNLANLKINQDKKYENINNTIQQETNTVADILIKDIEERKLVQNSKDNNNINRNNRNNNNDNYEDAMNESHIYESILDNNDNNINNNDDSNHNDSTISSASQLLEDPSPMSWIQNSPINDCDGKFTLRRQRGIRRKRQQKNNDNNNLSTNKKPKIQKNNIISPESCRKILETGLPIFDDYNKKLNNNYNDIDDLTFGEKNSYKITSSFNSHSKDEITKINMWDLDSPKSSLIDDYQNSKNSFLQSVIETPEAPLIATVRRCLKYSPECDNVNKLQTRGSIEIEYNAVSDYIHIRVIRCKDLRRTYEGPIHAYVKVSLKNHFGEGVVKRTAVHRATPNPVFHETLILPCPSNNSCTNRPTSLDIAVWHRDRRARRSELLGCMTLPLPLAQDKEATWHPLEVGSCRNTSTPYTGLIQECAVSPPLSKDGDQIDNNNANPDDLTYLRHLELEQIDPLTGQPLHPGFTAKGGRTPCTITKKLLRQCGPNQIPWGFSLSWGRPPRVERVDPNSPADRAGLRPGDHVVFVNTTNVVILARENILGLIQAATNQLVLEVYRKTTINNKNKQRTSIGNITLNQPTLDYSNGHHQGVTFTTEIFKNVTPDATPEEELVSRETRYNGILKSGFLRFYTPLSERRDIISLTDYSIIFQNIDELLKLSDEIRDSGGSIEIYLNLIPKIIALYRRYLSGLQRACCLLVSLKRNAAFVKIITETTQKRRPELTDILLAPLEHYREMTRIIGLITPRNCQKARDLLQGYREATANANLMEPPRDSGRPLLSLQEIDSRLVFAKCNPFTLGIPERKWIFGGALTKVEGRRLQSSWALLLTDLLVFARFSRDRVLFITEEPLHLSNIAEACFTVRKRPTEFRLQIAITTNGAQQNSGVNVSHSGGCSPHGKLKRRLLIFRAPTAEIKAVWHCLLQRQIIYVNTGCGGIPNIDYSPEECQQSTNNILNICDSSINPQPIAQTITTHDKDKNIENNNILIKTSPVTSPIQEINHLAQWVRNSQHAPPPDNEQSLEEWTPEELAARAPRDTPVDVEIHECNNEEINCPNNSDIERQSSTSSASLSTIKSNNPVKNGSLFGGKDTTKGSINMCRRCHRSGCPAPPTRDPFSPLPQKITTPDLCANHRLMRNNSNDSPSKKSAKSTSADNNTEDGSEDDLDCDEEPPYRTLRRFGTLSSLDQDDDEQIEEDNHDIESPPSGTLRSWAGRASSFVVSKMVLLEQLASPQLPKERNEFSILEQNDEDGTVSGGTSADDIWGTPTSGGPDDDSFNSPPSTNGNTTGDNYGLSINQDDEADDSFDSEDLPEITMDQLMGNSSMSSLHCFLSRKRLEPLPEEDDTSGNSKNQVGWW
ncbi:hypothetical protein HCN44_009141 [Aphidius gifuensis]|uniref:Uncharacterized protein n=1 Tax=Aphidius gifuensis TaxID=684658 RepID=A0A835CXS5_APHGI|nr:uncharacterized protein LOC122856438 isoform X3 [Aphidius gifuensis]KAF7997743.1 hypothetical protein HCN44_009141 [Aphidius gifuensis]